MPHNALAHCILPSNYRLAPDTMTKVLSSYVFPVQFVFGVLGNSLNLWVLVSDEMPNIASDLLAAVSFCDLAFLLSMLPYCIASFDAFAFNYSFRVFYLHTKQHIAALANWMSAAAIWLILAVALERLLVVRNPLRSKTYWERGRMALVLSSIFFITGILTFYHHFEYDCTIKLFCNGTQIDDSCSYSGLPHTRDLGHNLSQIIPSRAQTAYLEISTVVNAVGFVLVPILLLILFNIFLLMHLNNWHDPHLNGSSTSHRLQARQRRRVTITVIAIGIAFSITNAPSAVLAMIELYLQFDYISPKFYQLSALANSLVVTGKTLNFILFCLSSEHFRRKCLVLLLRKVPRLSQSSLGRRLTANSSKELRTNSLQKLRSRRETVGSEHETAQHSPLSDEERAMLPHDRHGDIHLTEKEEAINAIKHRLENYKRTHCLAHLIGNNNNNNSHSEDHR